MTPGKAVVNINDLVREQLEETDLHEAVSMETERLQQTAKAEMGRAVAMGIRFPVELTPHAALALIGELQLALRHQRHNREASSDIARAIIHGLVQMFHTSDMHAVAALALLGDDPEPRTN